MIEFIILMTLIILISALDLWRDIFKTIWTIILFAFFIGVFFVLFLLKYNRYAGGG